MHPRLSVSQVSTWHQSLDEDLAFYERTGIDRVGASFRKLADTGDPVAAAHRLADAGLHVTNLLAPGPFTLDDPSRWPAEREVAGAIVDAALAARPDVVVLTTGPAGSLTWERAADALEEAWRGTLREAEREGLTIAIEHTNPLHVDVGFVHTLRDAVELAWRLDTGVCVELNACWAERNLAGTLSAAIDVVSLVQVSDYAVGTLDTPNRLVPGDGDIPLLHLVRLLHDAGYEGPFDLEIIGPRIEEEGYDGAVERSLRHLEALLDATSGVIDVDETPSPT